MWQSSIMSQHWRSLTIWLELIQTYLVSFVQTFLLSYVRTLIFLLFTCFLLSTWIRGALSSETATRRCSVKQIRLKIYQNSQQNTCVEVLSLIKLLWHRFFPVSFAKFFKTPFFMQHLWWLLLRVYNLNTNAVDVNMIAQRYFYFTG